MNFLNYVGNRYALFVVFLNFHHFIPRNRGTRISPTQLEICIYATAVFKTLKKILKD